ncbi:MAG: hypothetical protein J6O71_00915 [Lachnospiraceae bacterium]|nr:hypothetical protein [Lachnospiraceae bacterium]
MNSGMKKARIDFTGIYSLADPFDGAPHLILDCTELSGCTMYVDSEAEDAIRYKLSECPVEGIHFLDNGNYHYVTRFFLERIVSPFSLLVFDKHTDDQEPAFEGLRSCGSWIRDARADIDNLKEVMLVQGRDMISGALSASLPVYVSIDLDVLSESELKVNWDQGELGLSELCDILIKLLKDRDILGIDICGGCLPGEDRFIEDNKRVFNELYKVIENQIFREGQLL